MPLLRAATAALLVSAVLLPAWPTEAASPPDTCDGLAATIVGTDGDDTLNGTAGNDVVSLGDGDDVFYGDQGGNDVVCAGGGADELRASSGVIHTGADADRVYALNGTPTVHTGPGNDIVLAEGPAHIMLGPGNDEASVLEGATVVEGGSGADRFDLWSESDPDVDATFRGARLDGGAGPDTFHWTMDWPMRLDLRSATVTSHGSVLGSGSDNDSEAAVRGMERYVGGGRNDLMIGHRGRDVFFGGLGNDVLVGGAGRDVAHGGRGTDTCRAEARFTCERR